MRGVKADHSYYDRILELTKKGLSRREIADRLGVTMECVKYARSYLSSKSLVAMSEKDKKTVLAMSKQGWSIFEIYRATGIKTWKIAAYRKNIGFLTKAGPGHRLTEEKKSEICRLIKEGHALQAIARMCKVNKGTVACYRDRITPTEKLKLLVERTR